MTTSESDGAFYVRKNREMIAREQHQRCPTCGARIIAMQDDPTLLTKACYCGKVREPLPHEWALINDKHQ